MMGSDDFQVDVQGRISTCALARMYRMSTSVMVCSKHQFMKAFRVDEKLIF